MTALAAARFDLSNKGPTPFSIGYKAEASQTFYNGAMVAKNSSGYLVPAATTAGLRVVGVCDLGNKNSVLSSSTQGDTVINVRSGIFAMKSGTSTDAVTIADLENDVYVLDDQTISRLPGSGRAIAGVLKKIEGSLFHIAIGTGTAAPSRSGAGGGTAYQGAGSTETISSAGALSVNTEISLVSVTGTTAYTLADGLFKGQRKIVTCTAGASTPVGTVTPATPSGFATVTAIGAAGDSVELIWTGAAWVLGPSFGVTFT
jgi:hypothetical protein